MKATGIIALAFGLAVLGTVGATAQSQGTKVTTETKTEIKNGKDLTVTGCLERGPGTDYVLTGIRQIDGKGPTRYALITKDNLSSHVGHRVEIHGKTATDAQGTVSVETKTKTQVGDTPDQKTKTKTESTSSELAMPFLSVGTIEARSPSCN